MCNFIIFLIYSCLFAFDFFCFQENERCVFESKSQLAVPCQGDDVFCYNHVKGTILKANHNPFFQVFHEPANN